MLKFTSRGDVNAEYKCIIRLLDDAEVLECDVQVRSSIRRYRFNTRGPSERRGAGAAPRDPASNKSAGQ